MVWTAADRFRGQFRVIPRYSAAESGAKCAKLRFRPFEHPRPRYSAFGRADSACHRIPRLGARDATRVRIAWLILLSISLYSASSVPKSDKHSENSLLKSELLRLVVKLTPVPSELVCLIASMALYIVGQQMANPYLFFAFWFCIAFSFR